MVLFIVCDLLCTLLLQKGLTNFAYFVGKGSQMYIDDYAVIWWLLKI